jgi:fructokinase
MSTTKTFDALIYGEALVDLFGSQAIVGGAPLNVARHLAGFGFRPLLITRIGDDDNGRMLRDEMQRFGMDTRGVQIDAQAPTGVVRVEETGPGSHRFTILKDQAYDRIELPAALAAIGDAAASIRALCYGSLIRRAPTASTTLDGLLAVLPATRVFDLNWRNEQIDIATALAAAALADEIKLNHDELHLLGAAAGFIDEPLSAPPEPGTVHSGIARWLDAGRAQSLVVTFGAAGYAAFARDGECVATGTAQPIAQMVDTVGAGDAFVAAMLAGRLAGWPLARRLQRANAFAAAACGWRGAVSADLKMYTEWRRVWQLDRAPIGAGVSA